MVFPRAATLLLAISLPATAFAANIQKSGLKLPSSAAANQAAVVKIFNESYSNYLKFAFPHDELSPLSQSFSDPRNGWGASVVDAMDTIYIMGLNDLFLQAVNFTKTIDFNMSQTPDTVDVFETTIRYVGGLLSAYELSGKQYPILVQKAQEVADKLAFAWDGSVAVPFGSVNFTTNSPVIGTSNIAEAGTLTLEWTRLSTYTGNQTYADLTLGSVQHMANLVGPLPGMPAQGIDPSTGLSVGGYVTWGGGSDSYFEYLIKYARLSNTNDQLYINTWATAVDSSIRKLQERSIVGNHLYLADFNDGELLHVGSHLACYLGGNWIMGGKMLNNDTIVNTALELIDGCWNTYASTETGIGPETFAYISPDGNFTGGTAPTAAQLAFNAKHGFYITTADYIQRPEVLESNFYAWRATGDTKYLDRAASAIKSFNTYLQTPTGFAGINDVDDTTQGLIDDTESFWFAEVMKYLYLTFDDPNHISLDNYVFNTEAHPLQAPPAKATYTATILSETTPFVQSKSSAPLPAVSPTRFNKAGVRPA